MNIVDASLSTEQKKLNSIRIQVRVKGIIETLKSDTTPLLAPMPVFQFLQRLTQEGKFIPTDYFSQIEKKRLTFDTTGRLK